jgi:hypothetical protein
MFELDRDSSNLSRIDRTGTWTYDEQEGVLPIHLQTSEHKVILSPCSPSAHLSHVCQDNHAILHSPSYIVLTLQTTRNRAVQMGQDGLQCTFERGWCLETDKQPVVFSVGGIECTTHPLSKHFGNAFHCPQMCNNICFDCHYCLPLYLTPGELIRIFECVEPCTTGGGGIGKTAVLGP